MLAQEAVNTGAHPAHVTDLFAKCAGSGGYFGAYRAQHDTYFTQPVLEGGIGPRMRFNDKEVIVWSINNYLGIAGSDQIKAASRRAFEEHGTWSPMGSRMLTGNTLGHVALEKKLAAFCQKPAALVFNYGYLGVLGTVSALVGPNDIVLIDKLSHASIVDAAMLAVKGQRRQLRVFDHNNPDSLERRLKEAQRERRGGILIVTEGVFGMTGDLAPLPEICALKRRYAARLLVDDAHGFGVMGKGGRGSGEHSGTQDELDLYFATFAKSFAAIGGVTAGAADVIDYVCYNARTHVFAKSLPSIYVSAVGAALELIANGAAVRERLWRIARRLQSGLVELGFNIGDTQSPITPVYVRAGDEEVMTTMMRMLRDEHGVFVSGVTYPVVPRGVALFRLTPTAAHGEDDVDITLAAFKQVRDALRERIIS